MKGVGSAPKYAASSRVTTIARKVRSILSASIPVKEEIDSISSSGLFQMVRLMQ
ncbi:hypothetical protein GCM10019060_41360 [Novosphingobium pokkalii]|nr:hypothetical protein GCM10019060_41360 [Novosphingobium pokkalii]